MAAYEATPDKVDSLFLQISTVEAQGESLATRLSIAIRKYTSAKGEKKPDRGLYYEREIHAFERPDTIQN